MPIYTMKRDIWVYNNSSCIKCYEMKIRNEQRKKTLILKTLWSKKRFRKDETAEKNRRSCQKIRNSIIKICIKVQEIIERILYNCSNYKCRVITSSSNYKCVVQGIGHRKSWGEVGERLRKRERGFEV